MRKTMLGLVMLGVTTVPLLVAANPDSSVSGPHCPTRFYMGQIVLFDQDVRPFTVPLNKNEGFISREREGLLGQFYFDGRAWDPQAETFDERTKWAFHVAGQARSCFYLLPTGEVARA